MSSFKVKSIVLQVKRYFRALGAAGILCMFANTGVAASDKPVTVSVSILPLKTFVERIGGRHVQAVVLVPPGKSPATYEPSPRQMETVAASSLYFSIGVPFEKSWIPRLKGVAPQIGIVDLQQGITLRPVDLPPGAPKSAGGQSDPHIWLSPPLVMTMADRILEALSTLKPEARTDFAANHHRFVTELNVLDQDIRTRLARKKNRSFMVFHPSWGYFADAYGLKQIPIEAAWKEPGPKALQHFIEYAKKQETKVIFIQKQFSDKEALAVAQSIGGEVVSVDPLSPDYVSNFRKVADVFARSLN